MRFLSIFLIFLLLTGCSCDFSENTVRYDYETVTVEVIDIVKKESFFKVPRFFVYYTVKLYDVDYEYTQTFAAEGRERPPSWYYTQGARFIMTMKVGRNITTGEIVYRYLIN